MRDKNIYYRLVKNEDTFTEAFINLLANDDIKNRFIEVLIEKTGVGDIKFDYSDIKTQVSNYDYGRPDIVIENKDLILVIENKINSYTELTENQKGNYVNFLNDKEDKKIKLLIFIIPKTYMFQYKVQQIPTHILYWEEILLELQNASIEKYFTDFISIANSLMNYEIITIEESDMEHLAKPESFIKLVRILESLKKLFSTNSYKIDDEKNGYSYGFFVKSRTINSSIYIGIVYDLWISENEPIYIGFHDSFPNKAAVIKKENEKILTTEDDKDWSYIKIPLALLIAEETKNKDNSNEIFKLVEVYLQ